ncbi:MAG: calcium/sodium antiporter [Deltaproteobacteria bacterium]
MLLTLLATCTGIAVLAVGAERFVVAAASLARRLGVSPLFVGLTIVSVGTSFPELVVSATAVLSGHSALAVGNILGSNIANVFLVLGLSSLLQPVKVDPEVMVRDYSALLLATVTAWLMSSNGMLGRLEGTTLLAGRGDWKLKGATTENGHLPTQSLYGLVGRLVVSLVLLLIGSRLLIWGGVGLARAVGVSELVIGLTVVALGTSLPELATTLTGIIKKQDAIAVGNVVGSNIFNTLAILGTISILRPLPISSENFSRDFPATLLASLILWPVSWSRRKGQGRVNRFEGGILLGLYGAYLYLLTG